MAMENTVNINLSSNGQIFGPFDVTSINSVSLQWSTLATVTSTPLTGSVTYQISTDGISWNTATYMTNTFALVSGAAETFTGTVTSGYRTINLNGATHFRLFVSAYTSGSVYYNLNLNGNASNSFSAIANSVFTSPAGTQGTAQFTTTAATTNATATGFTGNLFYIGLTNTSASTIFFKLYNKAAAPTVGTDVPILTIPVAANSFVYQDSTMGLRFTSGISWATTGAIADSDTTAIAAGCKVALMYRT